MPKKRAFISFDYEHDEDLRSLLVGQARNPDSPFDIADWSVKEPWPQYTWEERCLERIRRTDLAIVIVGEHTHRANGVITEIRLAKQAGVPFFGIHGRSGKSCSAPEGLAKVYKWTWDNLKALMGGAR